MALFFVLSPVMLEQVPGHLGSASLDSKGGGSEAHGNPPGPCRSLLLISVYLSRGACDLCAWGGTASPPGCHIPGPGSGHPFPSTSLIRCRSSREGLPGSSGPSQLPGEHWAVSPFPLQWFHGPVQPATEALKMEARPQRGRRGDGDPTPPCPTRKSSKHPGRAGAGGMTVTCWPGPGWEAVGSHHQTGTCSPQPKGDVRLGNRAVNCTNTLLGLVSSKAEICPWLGSRKCGHLVLPWSSFVPLGYSQVPAGVWSPSTQGCGRPGVSLAWILLGNACL